MESGTFEKICGKCKKKQYKKFKKNKITIKKIGVIVSYKTLGEPTN